MDTTEISTQLFTRSWPRKCEQGMRHCSPYSPSGVEHGQNTAPSVTQKHQRSNANFAKASSTFDVSLRTHVWDPHQKSVPHV